MQIYYFSKGLAIGCIRLTSILAFSHLAGAATYQLAFNPTNYDFGTVEIGQSVTKTFTLTNTGTGTTTFANGTPTVPKVYGFSLSASTCGNSLVPGSSCEVTASYAPQTPGRGNASLYVEIQKSTNRFTADYLVLGSPRIPTVSPLIPPATTWAVQLGQSVTKTFTLTNTGTGTTTFANGTPTVPKVYGFSLSASTCGKSLIPGSSCAVTASYAPQTPGRASASLSVEIQESPIDSPLVFLVLLPKSKWLTEFLPVLMAYSRGVFLLPVYGHLVEPSAFASTVGSDASSQSSPGMRPSTSALASRVSRTWSRSSDLVPGRIDGTQEIDQGRLAA